MVITMEKHVSENSEFVSEHRRMSALCEARDLIRQIAEPCPAGDKTKAALRRVHHILHKTWSFNRVRDVWNADPRIRVRGDELDELRKVAAARRKETHQKAAADELSELRARIDRLEYLLAKTAPGARIHAPGQQVGEVVPADRAVD
jgi:hypothetical protein